MLQVLEGLQLLLKSTDEKPLCASPFQFLSENQFASTLKNWYMLLKTAVSLENGNNVIIIDDISVFLSLGVPEIQVLDFINSCQSLICNENGSEPCANSLIVGVKKPKADDESKHSSLYWHLAHEAMLLVNTEQLSTGLSKTVTGLMTVSRNSLENISPIQQTYLYKLEDRRVKILPTTKGSDAIP